MVNPPHAGQAVAGCLEMILAGEGETLALGRALGWLLRAGDVVLLSGELGAGKTTLAKGLAAGLGVDDSYVVTSPTFTLLNIYPGRLDFFHADLYRLGSGEAEDLELLEEAAGGVLAVEWADLAPGLWPAQALGVELHHLDGQRRRARLRGPRGLLDCLARALNP